MAMPQLSYFTCTLSEALEHNVKQGSHTTLTPDGTVSTNDHYENVNDFVDFLASKYGNHLAVGGVTPVLKNRKENTRESVEECLTFEDVRRLSTRVGSYLEKQLRSCPSQSEWVALLSTSSPIFLLVWLGLMRFGYKVLLIAPQSSSQTIQHLLRLSQAGTILHDGRQKRVVDNALASAFGDTNTKDQEVQQIQLPWTSISSLLETLPPDEAHSLDGGDMKITHVKDVVYSFHSSGTTGLPKLIPQTNHGAVGVLPMLQQTPDKKACFTTTPLYSGGIADIFRSWSAAAPLWLFPEGVLPITASNVLSCILSIDKLGQRSTTFPTTKLCFLSCVPFVLESMLEHKESLQRLQEMEMVGVGGAAMPKSLGDALVQRNIRLLSRFGSSENGFLMSSARDFEHDKQWDVLSCTSQDGVEFKRLDGHDDRFELIILSAWPLVSNANHATRPFNTHDVFMPHPEQVGHWHYKGRSDAQLTLRTGRKVDPTELETVLRGSEYIEEAVIVGEGQPMPAALIFTSEQGQKLAPEEFHRFLRSALSNANNKVAKYANIGWNYVRIISSSEVTRIPKNSKGGVIRSAFATEFAAEISSLYDNDQDGGVISAQQDTTSADSILSMVRAIVTKQVKSEEDVSDDDDLFEAGLDSQGCISICQQLKASTGLRKIQMSTIYECGTIRHLSEHISQMLGVSSNSTSNGRSIPSKTEEMLEMVHNNIEYQWKRLQDFSQDVGSNDNSKGNVFLLTGATGFLGTHMLHVLLRKTNVTKIFVFIRGSRTVPHEEHLLNAKARVQAALSFHRLANAETRSNIEAKVQLVPTFLKDDNIGIASATLTDIIRSVTHIIHAAWEVNFNLSLRAFSSHIKATVDLYNFAILASQHNRRNVSFTFCSSLASIQNAEADLQAEVSNTTTDASSIGYGQSKWVAENVLHTISQNDQQVSLNILRVGQLSGDIQHGIWHRREAWPLMMDAAMNVVPSHDLGPSRKQCVFPDIAGTNPGSLDWLPVDQAAREVVQTTLDAYNARSSYTVNTVANTTTQLDWGVVQEYIMHWAVQHGYDFTLLPPHKWLDRVEASKRDHQAKALLPLWRTNWGDQNQPMSGQPVQPAKKSGQDLMADSTFDLDEDYFHRILSWIAEASSR